MTANLVIVLVASIGLADNGAHLPGAEAMPWYDIKTQELKRVDVAPQDPFDDRGTKWKLTTQFAMPRVVWTILEVLMWCGLILVFVYIVYRVALGFMDADLENLSFGASAEPQTRETRGDQIRIESLPFRLVQTNANLLDEARRFDESGDLNQAIIYLYSYLLVELDRHQVIRLNRGKTNRQYLRETRSQPELFAILRDCMIAFEDVFFGEQLISRDRFDHCWSAVPKFRSLLARPIQ